MKLSELKTIIELMEMSLSEDISENYKKRLKKEESFREKMYKFDDVLQGKVSKDKTNKPLSKELKKKYRSNVTKFMRDMLGLKKKVK